MNYIDGRKNRRNEYNEFISRLYGNNDSDDALVREVTFQVTNRCNLACDYCYEHHKSTEDMSIETARRIVDLIINMWKENKPGSLINKNTKTVVLSFIGGEPLLVPKLIEDTIEYFIIRCAEEDCSLVYMFRASICTNGQNYFDEDVQHLINRYRDVMSLNVSIDGVKELHDAHRVRHDGSGSFDAAFKAYLASNKYGYRSTKMTFVPESFKYIYDSVKFMIENGSESIACNYAYEPVYTVQDAKLLYKQLCEVADYMIDKHSNVDITMLDFDIGRPIDKRASDEDKNWCGGTGAMLAFAPDGKAYPCLRYCPISIGEEKAAPMMIGDFYGIYNTPRTIKIKEYLDSITKRSQSTKECLECPVQSGCGWCSAYNYEATGSVNKRITNVCEAHKARCLASYRYHNKRYLALHDCEPNKIYLPKSDALKIVSEEEWLELKNEEEMAVAEYNSIIDMFGLQVIKID